MSLTRLRILLERLWLCLVPKKEGAWSQKRTGCDTERLDYQAKTMRRGV
jgi:hypothetical protein